MFCKAKLRTFFKKETEESERNSKIERVKFNNGDQLVGNEN